MINGCEPHADSRIKIFDVGVILSIRAFGRTGLGSRHENFEIHSRDKGYSRQEAWKCD